MPPIRYRAPVHATAAALLFLSLGSGADGVALPSFNHSLNGRAADAARVTEGNAVQERGRSRGREEDAADRPARRAFGEGDGRHVGEQRGRFARAAVETREEVALLGFASGAAAATPPARDAAAFRDEPGLVELSSVVAVAASTASNASHLDEAHTIHATDAKSCALQVVFGCAKADGMGIILWGCVAALVSVLVASVIFLSVQYQQSSANGDSASRAGPTEALRALMGSRGKRKDASRSASSVNALSVSRQGTVKSEVSAAASDDQISWSSAGQTLDSSAAPLPGLPLCPLLMVPDGTRLACTVQNDVRRRKQEMSFNICAVPARGGTPLFRVRASERGEQSPGIYIETLSGREQLALLSTEEVWKENDERPLLSISRPWGLPYGTIQKAESGDYHVMRGTSLLLVFAGDFDNHSIKVRNSTDSIVATTMQTCPEEYQVHIQARMDASLVILGLLAIDKCELMSEPPKRKSSSGASSEAGHHSL